MLQPPGTSDATFTRVRTWAPRVLLAAVYIFEGADKFSQSRLWTGVFSEIGLGTWFRPFTACAELVGALLLLTPGRTRLGVALLFATMIGALLTHLFVVGIGPQTVIVGILLALLCVAWSGAHA